MSSAEGTTAALRWLAVRSGLALSFAIVLFACVLAGSVLPAVGMSPSEQVDVTPYSGTILYLSRGDIWQIDLATEQPRLFLDPGPGLVTHVAHSPDRSQLAYSVLHLSPTYQVLASEIVLATSEGTGSRTVVREDRPRLSVSWPAWSGDAATLAYMVNNLVDGTQRVEQVDLGSLSRSLVVEGASSPTASADGRWMAYAQQVGRRWSIWSMDRSTGQRTQLVSEAWFEDADVPSFSPDSSIVSFVAVGDGPPAGAGLSSLVARVVAGLAPSAEAHDIEGAVFDLWGVRPDGSGLRRVAALANEQPYVAWSPDGRHVAVWGGIGLQIVDAASGALRVLRNPVGTGPISWGY